MDIPDTLPAGHYAIYALLDPTDDLVYYVGQSRSPQVGYVLTDWAVPLWASGLQTTHLSEEKQVLAALLKQEAAAVIRHGLARP
jgi:hypothetical protein